MGPSYQFEEELQVVDAYTKTVLTVIAMALSVIALKHLGAAPAIAKVEGCGAKYTKPCYVEITDTPIKVWVDNFTN